LAASKIQPILDAAHYLRRRGRLTTAQARAIDTLGPEYLLDLPMGALPARFWRDAFGREGPLAIEVGFGNGTTLVELAKANPSWNCVGVDVYRPGFGALILACEREEIGNVRIADAEALAFLTRLEEGSVSRLQVFFPDPWPKKRHHKRRLVTERFAAAAARCLASGGSLGLATDWAPYAARMVEVLDAEPGLAGGVTERGQRAMTPFETKGVAEGRQVADLVYRRVVR